MSTDKVYWTMCDGHKIDVDEMSETHVRNTLKMLIRKQEEDERKRVEDDLTEMIGEGWDNGEFYKR
jgi:uncharacterized protein (UPF0335 family)